MPVGTCSLARDTVEQVMAARTKSKVTPKYKTKYRVKNWPAYEAALRKRGDVTLWFDEDALAAWNASPSGRAGGQRRYSDLAILTALSRRGSTVVVPALAKMHDEPIHLVIDSTGLKIVGDGEWHAHKHKTSNKRRSWRKLHLGVDGDGFIVASSLTDSGIDDASVGVAMIKEGEASIGRFTADGAYDTTVIYQALATAGLPGIAVVIPPRRTASPSKSADDVLRQRDVAIARIAEVGRRQWRKESGAHQQARAENAMSRYKQIIGDRLRAKRLEAQKREAAIAVNAINRMTKLGMPESVQVSA